MNFSFAFILLQALGNDNFYPTNGNVELENLYKYYKSTGQVRNF